MALNGPRYHIFNTYACIIYTNYVYVLFDSTFKSVYMTIGM